MANWHHDNPIMTTNTAVSNDELLAYIAGKTIRDLRIDSTGRMFTRIGSGEITYSDVRRHFDLDCGLPTEYSRNFFGAIVRGA